MVAALTGAVAACTTTAPPPDAASAGPVPAALVGTAWRAVQLNGKALPEDAPLTLRFEDGGRVAGSTGCNRYFASVVLDEGDVSVSDAGSTRRACPQEVMRREGAFLQALQQTRRYREEGDARLVLLDSDGTVRLALARTGVAPDAPASADATDRAVASSTRFSCAGGPDLEVRFLGPETVRLTDGAGEYTLQRQRSASGARYVDEGIEFWNKGSEALFTRGGEQHRCAHAPEQ